MALPTTATTINALTPATGAEKTMMIAVDSVNDVSGDIETEKLTIEQLYDLIKVIGNEPPIGMGLPWFTDTVPTGYLELNGQTFDKTIYPELGNVFTSGKLPDMRQRVPKGVYGTRHAQQTEEDQVKSHAHNATFKGSHMANHSHGASSSSNSFAVPVGLGSRTHTEAVHDSVGLNAFIYSGGLSGSQRQVSLRATTFHPSLKTSVSSASAGTPAGSVTVASAGASENTVKGMFVRWVVRAK